MAFFQPFTHPDPAVTVPVFTPALAALVTSPLATTAPKTHTPAQLVTPPSLPPRAFPDSEEARLLGPLIPQRIKAIRRRYWNDQVGKLRAPIAVEVSQSKQSDDNSAVSDILDAVGLDRVDHAQGQSRLAELEQKATVSVQRRPRVPRRLQSQTERATKGPAPIEVAKVCKTDSDRRVFSPSRKNSKWHNPKTVTPRLMRRQYARVLSKSPVVHVEDARGDTPSSKPAKATKQTKPFQVPGFKISVGLSDKSGNGVLPLLSDEAKWWLERDRDRQQSGKKQKSPGN